MKTVYKFVSTFTCLRVRSEPEQRSTQLDKTHDLLAHEHHSHEGTSQVTGARWLLVGPDPVSLQAVTPNHSADVFCLWLFWF